MRWAIVKAAPQKPAYAKYSAPKEVDPDPFGHTRLQTTIGVADDLLPADGATFLSYEQARAKANEWFSVAANKLTGLQPRRGQYTVTDACREYLTSLEGHSRSWYQTKSMINGNIVPRLGVHAVERLTRTRIEKWLLQLVDTPRHKPRNGLEPDSEEAVRRRKDTANRNLTVLKAALNRALGEGRIAASGLAWKQVKAFENVGQTRTRFLLMLKPVSWWRPVRLTSGVSFREISSAGAATRSWCGSESTISIPCRQRSWSRTANRENLGASTWNPEAAEFFSHIGRGKRGDRLMFDREDGSGYKEGSIKGMMAEAAEAAGIEPLTFHELRHTAASRWARLGADCRKRLLWTTGQSSAVGC